MHHILECTTFWTAPHLHHTHSEDHRFIVKQKCRKNIRYDRRYVQTCSLVKTFKTQINLQTFTIHTFKLSQNEKPAAKYNFILKSNNPIISFQNINLTFLTKVRLALNYFQQAIILLCLNSNSTPCLL